MKFEEALKAMREGKKVGYREEVYWIDEDERKIVRYEYDDNDGFLDTSVICTAVLFGADLLSDNWIIIDDDIVEQIFGEVVDD